MLIKQAIADLILHCSSGVDPLILQSLIVQESARHPYAIHDGKTHKSHFPKSREAAIQLAKQLREKGHRLDIGLAQINTQNFKWLGLTIETAFNPCTNLKASSTVLKEAMNRTPNLREQLSIYNSGKTTSKKGLSYADKIIRRAKATSEPTATNKGKSYIKPLFVKKPATLAKQNALTATVALNDGFSQNKASPMNVMLDGFSN